MRRWVGGGALTPVGVVLRLGYRLSTCLQTVPALYPTWWSHCCQMAEFWAAGPKNGPGKLLAAKEISGLESGPIPNLRPNFNNNWQKLA